MAIPSFPFMYVDPFAGASGDMFLGALLDLGYPFPRLRQDVAALGLDGIRLTRRRVLRGGISAVKVGVTCAGAQPHRGRREIRTILRAAQLEPEIRRQAWDVFDAIIGVEAGIHRMSVDRVHLHEVGALDALADVVGTVSALAGLGVKEIHAAPVNVGSGAVECAHGILPVPAPATAALLHDIPQYGRGTGEYTTPTGAALLRILVHHFGQRPACVLNATGYGAGTRDDEDLPNVLRLMGGQRLGMSQADGSEATLVELRCQLDDLDPRVYGHLSQRLLDTGARDVYLSPVQMKKGRPGTLIVILCDAAEADTLGAILLDETPTMGYRMHTVRRVERPRRQERVATQYGAVRIKVSDSGPGEAVATPEYEDCRRLALRRRVPLRRVLAAAQEAWWKKNQGGGSKA